MTESFNVEKFRQQMRGQAPVAPQAVPAQMQNAPVAQMPQAVPQQAYSAPQMQRAMPAPVAPQPMVPPMPQNSGFQTQPPNHVYTPPVAVQPQAWATQGQVMQAPQIMQPQAGALQMPPAPVFAPPPATVAAPQLDEAAPKKSRFSLKRLIKEKAPKTKTAAKDNTADNHTTEVSTTEVHTSKTSPAMIFMFGMATGIVCFLVGNMIMSTVFAG